MRKNKVVIITGPTATGKSDLGIELAKQFNGQIISADSRQVYRGMDLGTGKVETTSTKNVTKEEEKLGKCLSGDVIHYLLDVADPKGEVFNMAKFQKLAGLAIEHVFSKNMLPFIVGGTMLYIDALIKGYQNIGAGDEKLRKMLQAMKLSQLKEKLKTIDLDSYQSIDLNNRYRLIRAIEAKIETGKSFSKVKRKNKPNFDYLLLVLNPFSRQELYDRIDRRVDVRIEQGMIEEIKDLHMGGVSWDKMERLGLEYRYISRYLKGELKKEEMIEILKNKTHGYARRQLTWWRNREDAIWVKDYTQAKKQIEQFIAS